MKKDSLILTRKNSELDCENAKLNMRMCELRHVIRNNLEQTKQLRDQIQNTKSISSELSNVDRNDSGSETSSSLQDDRYV
jgi:hypothetical protein